MEELLPQLAGKWYSASKVFDPKDEQKKNC